MRLSWAFAWLLAGCFLGDGGNGGGSPGVPGSTRLPDLDAMQRSQLCEYLADEYPTRSVMCNDFSFSLGFSSAGMCSGQLPTASTCTATVDQTDACFEDLFALTDEELCSLAVAPPACAALFSEGCEPQQAQRPHPLP